MQTFPGIAAPLAGARSHEPSIVAALSYVRPGGPRPVSYACEPPPGVPWESAGFEAREVPIHDARGVGTSVQREGFELWEAPSKLRDFGDEEAVRATYHREALELALAATGAPRGWVFDHLVRRREPGRPVLGFGRATGRRAAANGRIHNDYTEASGGRRLALVVTDAHELERTRRYAIVNIWRSIGGPVLDTPLAVCDARTVSAADLVAAEVRYPNRTGEIYFLAHARQHRWSWFPEMDTHEALVFKQYDSQVSGVARFTPHAAFDHPRIPPHAPLRESIEVRCLVAYD